MLQLAPRWCPHPQLISLQLPLNHPPQTPSFLDRPGHPGPLTSNSRCPRTHSHPAGFWSSASGLLALSEQPGSTPGLNLPHTANEGKPPREPQRCLERKGGAGLEHRGIPTTFLARVLPLLPEHSWGPTLPPLWNAHSLPLQSTQESRLISHSGSKRSLL